nr:fumarylacetoacetate hydrolase family protein [Kineococcus siccus]
MVRVGPVGREVPAVLTDDGSLLDASGTVADVDGAALSPEGLAAIAAAVPTMPRLPAAAGNRFGAPVARPGKVVCIGLNYALHARESGAEIPAEPVVFLKTTDTVVGPHDEVLIPRGSTKTDYEVELAVVIGRRARYLADAQEAMACVAGYAVSNDVSEREFQLERGGQWDKGKSCETFNPLGPWLVTADEVPDPQDLQLWLNVDGQVRQESRTSDMVFGVAEIVRYLSRFMVLEPGDVINTGTPAGVALGFPDPKPYLRAGQVVELGIEGLGTQRQVVGQA